jgi:hypothetical protein
MSSGKSFHILGAAIEKALGELSVGQNKETSLHPMELYLISL